MVLALAVAFAVTPALSMLLPAQAAEDPAKADSQGIDSALPGPLDRSGLDETGPAQDGAADEQVPQETPRVIVRFEDPATSEAQKEQIVAEAAQEADILPAEDQAPKGTAASAEGGTASIAASCAAATPGSAASAAAQTAPCSSRSITFRRPAAPPSPRGGSAKSRTRPSRSPRGVPCRS